MHSSIDRAAARGSCNRRLVAVVALALTAAVSEARAQLIDADLQSTSLNTMSAAGDFAFVATQSGAKFYRRFGDAWSFAGTVSPGPVTSVRLADDAQRVAIDASVYRWNDRAEAWNFESSLPSTVRAFNGDFAVTGASEKRVHRRDRDRWIDEGVLGFPDLRSIHLSGDRAVARTRSQLRVFDRLDGEWVQTGAIERDGLSPAAMVLDGNRIAASYRPGPPALDVGSVVIYEIGPDGWTESAVIPAVASFTGGTFGALLALRGDHLVVGDSRAGVGRRPKTGDAYLFRRDGGDWSLVRRLVPPRVCEQARFGWNAEVTEDGWTLAIAYRWDDACPRIGFTEATAAFFALAPDDGPDCNDNGIPDRDEPDCDGNLIPDDCDMAMGAADCNDNGILDACEVRFGAAETQVLASPGVDGLYDFGMDVAISGDRAIATGIDSDRVVMLAHVEGAWQSVATFDLDGVLLGADIDGEVAAVWSNRGNYGGRWYRYRFDDGAWRESFWVSGFSFGLAHGVGAVDDGRLAYLRGNDFAGTAVVRVLNVDDPDDYQDVTVSMGWVAGVALDGDLLAVSGSEGLFVYRESEGSWSLEASLQVDGATFHFGFNSAIDGECIVVGDPHAYRPLFDVGDELAGAAFVFERMDEKWALVATLVGEGGREVADDVTISGNRILLGGTSDQAAPQDGAAFLYERIDGDWRLVSKLVPEDRTLSHGRGFGESVDLDGGTAIVGGPVDRWDTDAVYFFTNLDAVDCNGNGVPDACDLGSISADLDGNGRPDECDTCRGDLNLDGTVDATDLETLLLGWGGSGAGEDLTNDGVVDVDDMFVMLGRWGECP